MTKAQMTERIAELEKEVEALKAGASVETHIHYHYPQVVPQQQFETLPWYSPFYVGDVQGGGSGGITWNNAEGSM